MNLKKIFCKLLLIIILIFVINLNVSNALAIENDNQELLEFCDDAKSSILIECKTNTVLYKKNENEKLAPASMTKIMTMLLVMEKIDANLIGKA